MDRRRRHWTIALAGIAAASLAVYAERPGRARRIPTHLRDALAAGVLHLVVRVERRAGRTQRSKPRAVADQRDRASVGERAPTDVELALLSTSRIQAQRWRARLDGMDDRATVLARRD